MQYLPRTYEQINVAAGQYSPSPVKSYNNKSFAFWERSLFQRACSVLDFTLPDEWQGSVRDFFLYCLFRYGFVMVSKNSMYGQFFQPCSLYGYDFYYQPTEVIVSNPKMNKRFVIGKECELLKLTPDYMGIWDVIEYFAAKLSALDDSIDMNIINSKYSKIIGARNKASAEALKKILDKVNKGEPAVVADKSIFLDPESDMDPIYIYESDLQKNFILGDLLENFQTILSEFDNEIGIPTLPYQKKERMVTSEADSKQVDSVARCTVWLETLKSSIDQIKDLYPEITLDVKMREQEGGIDDGNGKDNTDRNGEVPERAK